MVKIYKLRPSHIILISFAVFIIIGTILLYLPISSKNGHLSFIDSLFMATSAVCVTGLAVVDVGNNLSYFGQIVLLMLIQIGGLGIMTFSTIFIYILKGEISVYEKLMIQESFAHTGRDIYLSIFHSIAAFCNAGFSPFHDSLIRYQKDTVINLTIIFLIISGGLGFFLLHEIKTILYSKFKKKVSLHTKMALIVTAILLFGGAVIFFALEKNNTIKDMGLHDQIICSLFQSVTTRTA